VTDDADRDDGQGRDGESEAGPAGRPAPAFAGVVGGDATGAVRLRPYDPDRAGDPGALWRLKRAFERELGEGGGDGKATAYGAKLTDDYRGRYLDWVHRCVADGPVVWLAVAVEGGDGATGTAEGDREANDGDGDTGASEEGGDTGASDVVGYAFLLPERLAMVWDGAVLNELYVAPAWRGTGTADALVGAVVRRAREQTLPMDRLLLDVAPSNERARAFYERHGFEPWGEMVAREI